MHAYLITGAVCKFIKTGIQNVITVVQEKKNISRNLAAFRATTDKGNRWWIAMRTIRVTIASVLELFDQCLKTRKPRKMKWRCCFKRRNKVSMKLRQRIYLVSRPNTKYHNLIMIISVSR